MLSGIWERLRQWLRRDAEISPPELLALRDRLLVEDVDLWEHTEALREIDFQSIGRLIQIHSYSILNGRRIINTLQNHLIDPSKFNSHVLQDSQVLEKLRDLVQENFPPCSLKESILGACETTIMHAPIRHNFAHWAVRRVKGKDAYVIFGGYKKEVGKHAKIEIDPGQMAFGIMSARDFRRELRKLQDHGENLAYAAFAVDQHKDDLPRFLASGRAIPKHPSTSA